MNRAGRRSVGKQGVRQQSRKIVIEREDAGVSGIALPVGAQVAGAQVALRIKLRCTQDGRKPALPGPASALGRDQHPLTRQRIQTPMRALVPD